jgi:uncharacterized Zn finger protein (UPF0148 family)
MAQEKIVNIFVPKLNLVINGATLLPNGNAFFCGCCFNRIYNGRFEACPNCGGIHIIKNNEASQQVAIETEFDEVGMMYFKPSQFTIHQPIVN